MTYVIRRLHSTEDAPSNSLARTVTAPATFDEAGVRMRVTFGAASGFYGGADGEMDSASADATILIHAVAGVRRIEHRVLVFGELAAGGGLTNYTPDLSPVGDVEVRVGADVFLGRLVVVGATVGASVLDRGDCSGAVMIGVVTDGRHR